MLCYDFIPFKRICKKKQAGSLVKEKEPSKLLQKLIEAWWIKAGFLFQSSNGLTAKLLKLVNEQKQLSQDHLKIQKKKKLHQQFNKSKDYLCKNRKKRFGL